MTENTCSIPTPEQRKYMEIGEAAERAMFDKVFKAIDDAAAEVADGFAKAGLEFEPTSRDYFTFTTQQVQFVRLCGGNPDTLKGGDPEIGQRMRSQSPVFARKALSSPEERKLPLKRCLETLILRQMEAKIIALRRQKFFQKKAKKLVAPSKPKESATNH